MKKATDARKIAQKQLADLRNRSRISDVTSPLNVKWSADQAAEKEKSEQKGPK